MSRVDVKATGTPASYAAFISYSHAVSGRLAATLQRWLERFATPWYRPRSLRIFRDSTSLSANEDLWRTIERALSVSEWFILLASPEAAASRWVRREVEWWRTYRSASRMCIVLTGGELHWDDIEGDWDWDRTTALPPNARSMFDREPLWVDLSSVQTTHELDRSNPVLLDRVAQIAAPIRGVDKDLLVGEHITQFRRARRQRRGGIAGLAILLVAAVVGALVAVGKANEANNQARIATARALASAAVANLDTGLDVAQLLAVQAYRTDPNPQTRSALLQTVTFSSQLVRYLPMGGQVTEVAGSGDGRTMVAGLGDGRVQRWNLADPKPDTVLTLGASISSLAVSRDGAVVVASDGTEALLWRRGRPATRIKGPPGQQAGAVTVSPSGRTAVVHMSEPIFDGPQSTVILDVPSAKTRATHDGPADPSNGLSSLSLLVAASDDELFLLDGGYGGWERRQISDWKLKASSNAAFGAHNYAVGTSEGGGSFTQTNGAGRIPVWRTDRLSDYWHPGFTAEAPISLPKSLTLSPNGAKVAVADSGTIFLAPVAREGAPHPDPVRLIGNSNINDDGVRFFGDDSHLLSASGDKVVLWDLGQRDRISRATRIPIEPSCGACSGPRVAVSPDGRRVAVVDVSGASAVIYPLAAGAASQKVSAADHGYLLDPPIWETSGQHLILPVAPLAEGSDEVVAAGRGLDSRTVVIVNSHGQIRVQDIESGVVRRTIPGSRELIAESRRLPTNGASAAVNLTGSLVAIIINGSVTITDVSDGKVIGTVPGADASFVTFAGPRLLIQRADGRLEVWDQRGSARERVLPGDGSYGWPPVANAQGTVVARQRSNGAVVLADLDTGATLATFPSPSGPDALKTGVAFTPDGRRMVTVTESAGASSDGQLIWRDISGDDSVRAACDTAGRDLTAAEWQTFVGTRAPRDLACR